MNQGLPVLEMEGVRQAFPTPSGLVEVLKGVDLMVREGDFTAITGPSGSGKTTILNLAALLNAPTSGRVVFDQTGISTLDEPGLCRLRKEKVGMVFQKFCLLPHRSVLENVLFRFRYMTVSREEALERSMKALERMGIAGKTQQPARLLSSGEMQRVAIARAVALPPRLLVADEPTGNLDRESATSVMRCFKTLNENGLSILLVTHNEELLTFCSQHLVCRSGQLIPT
ncbi:MAG: ABC transporter ATP-binding protein [Lentisphaerota bacterium]